MDTREHISPFCAPNINFPCCNGSMKLRKPAMSLDYEWVEEMCYFQVHVFIGGGGYDKYPGQEGRRGESGNAREPRKSGAGDSAAGYGTVLIIPRLLRITLFSRAAARMPPVTKEATDMDLTPTEVYLVSTRPTTISRLNPL